MTSARHKAANRGAGETPTAIRAQIAHCLAGGELEYFEDGLLVASNGRIDALGPAPALLRELANDVAVSDHRPCLLLPGFVDTHVHYVQTDIMAAFGATLLDWLERYAFPAEMQFADPAHAALVADFFLDQLLHNGTTSALVFGSVHPGSVDALFQAAQHRRMRVACGKVLMDRHCPPGLRDSAESGYADSRALLERWHGVDRLHYAITPRFAPTSSEAQLEAAGNLAREFPDALIQSHVAETEAEVAWVAKLFPRHRSYLDVYQQFGLLRAPAVYAHGIYLDATDRERMRESGAAVAFCPTSNLFLGSGLLDYEATARGRIGLATDVGGGTSLSMLRTVAEAYKVMALTGQTLPPAQALALMTLRGAEALGLDKQIGNFELGKEADAALLDPAATPLLARRTARAESIEDLLFALLMLGDDRCVRHTYVLGNCHTAP